MISLLLGALLAATPGPAWMKLTAPQRDEAIAALAGKPLRSRVLAASERFLGTPYVEGPLGEGQGKDPDPLISYEAVDCVTFVEETMALSLAPKPAEVLPLLTRIRYGGEQPIYEDRNHLMEAQWIPHNLGKGFIADVTRTYGGADTVTASKTFTDETWASKTGQGLDLPKDHQAKGTFEVLMIPLARFRAKAAAIPDGTIVVVVRDDDPEIVTRISHLGLLVHGAKGAPFMRHAALGPKAVIDEPLDAFIARHAAFKKWPVKGFALYAVTAPPVQTH